MAIQGNISDMEIETKRAISSIESSDSSLMHFMNLFPNNRFVTRQHIRFCKELLADYSTCADMFEKSRLLQRNINVNKYQTQCHLLLLVNKKTKKEKNLQFSKKELRN